VRRIPAAARAGPPVVAAYPNAYRVGMSNLGFQRLLELLSEQPLTVDRVFLPSARQLSGDPDGRGAPLQTLDLGMPLDRARAVLFSVAFEPDYVGLAQLLILGGVEPRARRRRATAPLVIAGGLAPTLNPEPLAPLCDLLGIGEAEALLPPLLELLLDEPSRERLLERCQQLPGWYVPALDGDPPRRRVTRQAAEPLVRPAYPAVLASRAAFSNHVDVEISRGCRWRCRFCAAGHVVTPYRELDLEQLRPALSWGLEQRGRVGLVGTDVSDHSGLESIARWVRERGGELALPSLRAAAVARSDGPLRRLIQDRPPRTLTLAVESATEDLRCALNKRLSHDELLRAARAAAGAGVQRLKVYLLAAVPGERQQDLEAMVDLALELVDCGPPGPLTLSVTGLVPKPGTPLQWEPAPDRHYLRQARGLLRSRLPGGRVELAFESPDWTRWQALLSLGGREVADLLLAAAEQGWRKVLARAAARTPLLQGRPRDPQQPLPWDFLDRGYPDEVLWRERESCRARRYVPPALIQRDPPPVK
jgi:radical SAM superfamily enzyme YgiQ (UPF0313 family)